MPDQVPLGVSANNAVRFKVDSVLTDMTTIIAFTAIVRRADGTEVTWAATIDATKTTKTHLEAVHTFAAGGVDAPMLGSYHCFPQLTPAGGGQPISATPDTLVVVAQ